VFVNGEFGTVVRINFIDLQSIAVAFCCVPSCFCDYLPLNHELSW
jgi:hypothetical protein